MLAIGGPRVATKSDRYSRQSLLDDSDAMSEVDFKGHFHPNELVRKVGRALVQMGYHLDEEELRIDKTPVGKSTGQFLGVAHGTTKTEVNPAGYYSYLWTTALGISLLIAVGLLALAFIHIALLSVGLAIFILLLIYRDRIFRREFAYGGELKADLIVGIPGEIYEDFRREEKIPISTSASAMIARKVKGYWTYDNPNHQEIRGREQGVDEVSEEWERLYQKRIQAVKGDMENLIRKMEAERDALL